MITCLEEKDLLCTEFLKLIFCLDFITNKHLHDIPIQFRRSASEIHTHKYGYSDPTLSYSDAP